MPWGFLNVLFIAGAATLVAPVIIHLIFRVRKRRMVFPSIRFLKESALRESRKLRLREWILLLLRCLACVLIALAFARPYRLELAAGLSGPRPRRDMVLVIDDSASMGFAAGGGTRLAEAARAARSRARDMAPGDRMGIVLTSRPATGEPEPTPNPAAVEAALTRLAPSNLRGDLPRAVETAGSLLADSPAEKIVEIYTDLQRTAFDTAALARAVSRFGDIQVRLAELPFHGEAAANLAVIDARVAEGSWTAGRPVTVRARVANWSAEARGSVAVRLVSGGKVLASRSLDIEPFSVATADLPAIFSSCGETAGFVEIDGRDGLPSDDRRPFSARLRGRATVACIEDSFSHEGFADDTYYLRMALDPRARGWEQEAEGGEGWVRAIKLTSAEVGAAALKEADAAFMAGVAVLRPSALEALEDFVRSGRGLAIFVGGVRNPIQEAFYNGRLYAGGKGLLPARIEKSVEIERPAGTPRRLASWASSHPVLAALSDPASGDLRLPLFYKYYRPLAADIAGGGRSAGPPGPERTEETGRPEVLASLDDGTPIILAKTFGRGRVVEVLTATRIEWNDLPRRKVFPALVHEMLRFLAGAGNPVPRQYAVGDELDLAAHGAAPNETVYLEPPRPRSGRIELTGADRPVLDTPGIYALSIVHTGWTDRQLIAAQLDPLESDLRAHPRDDILAALRGAAGGGPADAAGRAGEAKSAMLSPEAAEEIGRLSKEWAYLLLAALACLTVEMLLRDFWS
ncbi:MAG: BatA domain-containing protein [Planctomycetota bacterium]|nr:BatA domain-containing protein [Planctomycetota bacterium]